VLLGDGTTKGENNDEETIEVLGVCDWGQLISLSVSPPPQP
jgi:hypothetical protein